MAVIFAYHNRPYTGSRGVLNIGNHRATVIYHRTLATCLVIIVVHIINNGNVTCNISGVIHYGIVLNICPANVIARYIGPVVGRRVPSNRNINTWCNRRPTVIIAAAPPGYPGRRPLAAG